MKVTLGKAVLLAPAAALVACISLLAQTKAPPAPPDAAKFYYGGDAAQLAAQFTNSLVFLRAHVGQSNPSLFQLDTIAANSSLDPRRAAEIGRTDIASTVLNFDGVDVPFTSLPLIAKPGFGMRVGQPYEGTLGLDLLSRLVVEVDYGRQTVRAYAPENYKYSGKGLVFPLKAANGVPVVPVRFALAKGKEMEANFVVDTALDASVVFDEKFLASHHMMDDRGKVMALVDPISGEAGATMGKLRDFQIGKAAPQDVLAVFSSSSIPDTVKPVAGAIGAGMLRRFNVVFDLPHQQLIFTPNGHFGEPDQEDKSGLLIVAKGPDYKTFEVVAVQPGTPASDAGIQKGDVVAGVDTDPAADLSLLATRNLFCQVGHKYKITVQHGGETREVTIQMRRYY